MRKIFKYPLGVVGNQTVKLPIGLNIVHVDVQKGKPCLWILTTVDDDSKEPLLEDVHIVTFGTGSQIPDKPEYTLDYIGTYLLKDGEYVYHLFIKRKVE